MIYMIDIILIKEKSTGKYHKYTECRQVISDKQRKVEQVKVDLQNDLFCVN